MQFELYLCIRIYSIDLPICPFVEDQPVHTVEDEGLHFSPKYILPLMTSHNEEYTIIPIVEGSLR